MSSIDDSPFEVKTSDLLGRHLVAKRDLPEGSLIFEEAPIFVYAKFEETISGNKKSYCINCYRQLATKNVVACTKCKWPFCSVECRENLSHRQECEILSRNKILPDENIVFTILHLLCFEIMKIEMRDKWIGVMNLASTFSIEPANEKEFYDKCSVLAYQFLNRCGIDVTLAHVKEVINIFRINTFCWYKDPRTSTALRCLYAVCCIFTHSCHPNCECHPLTERERGTIGIFTRRPIVAGEMVTLCYSWTVLTLGSRRRQMSLFKRYSFLCACARCADPSESGSFYSAIKCNRCSSGWVLPPACLSTHNESRCSDCNHLMTSGEVERIEQAFRRKMVAILNKKCHSIKNRNKCVDDLISNATTQSKLHPNHNLVIVAIRHWLKSESMEDLLESTEGSRLLYGKIIERAERMLALVNLFGKISERVRFESIIASAMIRYHFKSRDCITIKKHVGNYVDKIKIYKKIVELLGKSIPLLSYSFLDGDTAAIIQEMAFRHVVWSDRLSMLRHTYRI